MLKKDTVVHVADTAYSHVIVLEQFIQPSPGNEVRLKRLYYAKDVGLVREEDLDSVKDSVTGHRSLQSCLINH